MKRNYIIAICCLAGFMISCYSSSNAQDVVPCLIFTGNSDISECIDLSKFNRITFEEDEMIISSTSNNDNPDIKLLYSLYNHLEFGDATPTDTNEIKTIETDETTQLCFQADTKTLILKTASDIPYSIGIFTLKGTLIAISRMTGDQSLCVESLAKGAYIAIASNGESKISIKFVL